MDNARTRAETIAELIDDQTIPIDDDFAFSAPWEARVVGIVLALREDPAFEWDDLKQRLVTAIAETDQAALQDDVEAVYYKRWLECVEKFLVDRDLSSSDEIQRRQREFESGDRDESEFVLRDDPHSLHASDSH